MGIKITNSRKQPALEYDRIKIKEIRITEKLLNTESEPKIELTFSYIPYAVDADGIIHYEKKQVNVNIADYMEESKKDRGDKVLQKAYDAIEKMIAKIISDSNRHGFAKVE